MATNNSVNYKPTQYSVQVGGAAGTLSNVAPSATSGVPVVSAGSSANPTFGTAVVAGGGTGITAAGAAYAPICAGTTTTGAFQTASSGIATSGFVLTSNGSSALPSWQASGSTITITGDTGGGLTGTSFIFTGGTTGLSFGGTSGPDTFTLTFAGITANGGTVSLATDATTSTINVGTGAGVKTSTFGSTNSTSTSTLQSGSGALNVTSNGGALTINSGTGALNISSDASATTVNVGTGSAAKAVTLGSASTTSRTDIRSGSAGIGIGTNGNGDFTVTTGSGNLSIGADGSNKNTILGCAGGSANTDIFCGTNGLTLGTNANAHTVTMGSTTGSSATVIQSGSGNVAINSGLTIDSTGRNTNAVQPAFRAKTASTLSNVTGDNTTYLVIYGSTDYNIGSSYNTSTGLFTAPIAGIYLFSVGVQYEGLTVADTDSLVNITSSGGEDIRLDRINPGVVAVSGVYGFTGSTYIQLSASETVQVNVRVSGSTKTVSLTGDTSYTNFFSAALIC